MDWLELNARTAIARDRQFRVILRKGPGIAPAQHVYITVEADTIWEMSMHGPIGPVLNAHVANKARKLAWTPRFDYWGDPVEELTEEDRDEFTR
jgi:hypothetical protein